jgi:hypothetical protein
LSFFDEADEPRTETRVPSRNPPRQRRPSGTGRRPPADQSVQTRRAVLAVVLLIVVILIALGVHSCQVSANESALKDYTNHVSSLVTQSNATGKQLFGQLAPSNGQGNGPAIQTQINGTLSQAEKEYQSARDYGAPDAVKTANSNFVLALKMRRDGIHNVASQIQPALGNQTSQTAVNSIAAEMARFYASDVLYKDYTAPAVAGALHSAAIAVGANGVTIAGGQFVPNVLWLTPTYIAAQLHVVAGGGKATPGTHGHTLNSVAVGSNTMVAGVTNHVPASPPPTFTFAFTNGGSNSETNVVCKVVVSGTGVSGQTTVPQTTAGKNGTCQVPLNSSPPTGNQTVTATIEKVPGETDTSNNSQTFTVDFQ